MKNSQLYAYREQLCSSLEKCRNGNAAICVFTFRVRLPRGKYCIIPCTFMPDQEGDFILRVHIERYDREQESNSPQSSPEMKRLGMDGLAVDDEDDEKGQHESRPLIQRY